MTNTTPRDMAESLPDSQRPAEAAVSVVPATPPARVPEIGGRKDGPEPTRYGDWEKNGRCVDF
jgi:hypothetical protein